MDLPLSYRSNSVLILVDCLNKFVSLLPCTFRPDHPFGVESAADLLIRYIVYEYSVSQSIVYDWDSQFTAELW